MSNIQANGMMAREVSMGPAAANAGQWSYPTFLDTMPRDAASVPAPASPNPPQLMVMKQESKRQVKEEKIKVAGQTVDDFMQGGAKPGAPGQTGKPSAKTTRAQRMAERAA